MFGWMGEVGTQMDQLSHLGFSAGEGSGARLTLSSHALVSGWVKAKQENSNRAI